MFNHEQRELLKDIGDGPFAVNDSEWTANLDISRLHELKLVETERYLENDEMWWSIWLTKAGETVLADLTQVN